MTGPRRVLSVLRMTVGVLTIGAALLACGGSDPASTGNSPAGPGAAPGSGSGSRIGDNPGNPSGTDATNPDASSSGMATAPAIGARVRQSLAIPVGPAPVEPTRMPAYADGDFRPAGYDTVFMADEFDGTSLDRSKWCTRMPWGGGVVLETPDDTCTRWLGQGFGDYANITENQRFREIDPDGETLHVVRNGTITLRATNSFDHKATRYAAAALRSKAVFNATPERSYYVTARVKMPSVLGTWPALFLIPSLEPLGRNQWPPEIDVFEGALNGQGDTVFTVTQHAQVRQAQTDSRLPEWTYAAPGFNTTWGIYTAPSSLRDRWVEIGAEWAAGGVCYFIDGFKTACENYRWVDNDGRAGNPATLIAYLAVGGPWAGSGGIDDSRMPASFEIDHIRVYEGDGRFVSSPGVSPIASQPAPQGQVPGPQALPANDVNDNYEPVGFEPVFADGFDGAALDRSRWCTRLAGSGGAPLQVVDAECAGDAGVGTADRTSTADQQRFRDVNSAGLPLHAVSDGVLALLATRTGSEPSAPWETAALRSKLQFVPGYLKSYFVTARVQLPDAPGVRAVFSIDPVANADGSLPMAPRASVFDAIIDGGGDTLASLRHRSVVNGQQTSTGQPQHSHSGAGFDAATGRFTVSDSLRGRWIEVGVEWTDGHLCWFVNGVPSACENYFWVTGDGGLANEANLAMYLAVDGTVVPTVDASRMLIDRITVMERAGN